MFEALFILTTVDTGTRVARFLVQELLGHASPRFGKTDWMPGALLSTTLVCLAWGTFVWTGSIATIWPMLGISNQLLACIALSAATTMIVRAGRARYAWVTLTPLLFVATATQTAGYQLVTQTFIPKMIQSGKAPMQGWILSTLCVIAMVSMLVIFAEAALRSMQALRAPAPTEAATA
jgi:carbon starvation protein